MTKKKKDKFPRVIAFIKYPARVIYLLLLATVIATVLIILLVLITISDLGYKNHVFANTSVGKIDVSGLSREEAMAKLSKYFDNYSKSDLKISIDGKNLEIPFASLGIAYDINQTADNIFNKGRDRSFYENQLYRIKSLFVSNNFDPVYHINYPELYSALDSKFSPYESKPQNAVISYKNGEYKIIEDKNGNLVDYSALLLQLRDKFNGLSAAEIPANLVNTPASLSASASARALDKIKTLDNQSITLSYEGQTWSLEGQNLVDILRFYRAGYDADYFMSFDAGRKVTIDEILMPGSEQPNVGLSLDSQKLNDFVSEISTEINRPTVDATLKFENGKVSEFRAAQDGLALDSVKTEKLILAKLSVENPNLKKNIVINLPVNATHAKIANEQINNLGITELVGRGISYFSHSIPNRIFNVGLGASRLSGTLVPPGSVFSFNNAVGEVSGATGYRQAYVISAGRTILDDGGGICQVSTTLFRAVLNSGLPVVTRTAHAYRVGYYEEGGFQPGYDATVWSPSVDFQFKNDTDHYLLVQSIMQPELAKLEIDIYGTRDGRKVDVSDAVISNRSPAPPDKYQDDPTLPKGTVKQVDFAAPGANVIFYRKVYKGGNLVIDESFRSNYRPWQAVFLVGTG